MGLSEFIHSTSWPVLCICIASSITGLAIIGGTLCWIYANAFYGHSCLEKIVTFFVLSITVGVLVLFLVGICGLAPSTGSVWDR